MSLSSSLLTGALAGFSATAPMTVSMQTLKLLLPNSDQQPLPPRIITEKIADRVGTEELVDSENKARNVTLVNHFAYGSLVGAAYGILCGRNLTNPNSQTANRARSLAVSTAKGIGFGLAVWSVSYQAWLPATGLFPPAKSQSSGRNGLMIAAHIVWGAALGVFTDSLAHSAKDTFGRES